MSGSKPVDKKKRTGTWSSVKELIPGFLSFLFIFTVILSVLSKDAGDIAAWIVFIIALPVAFIDIQYALMFYIATIPFTVYLPIIAVVEKSIGTSFLFITYFSILLFILKGGWIKKSGMINNKIKTFLVFYFGLFLASLFGMRYNLIHGGLELFFILTTGVALLIYFFFDSKNVLIYSMILIIVGGLVTGAVGVYRVNSGLIGTVTSDYETGREYDSGITRLSAEGWFDDANTAGAFFIICLGFLLSFLFYTRNLMYKLIILAASSFFIYAIIRTASRAALLILFVMAFFMFFRMGSKGKVISIMFILAFFFLTPASIMQRFTGTSIDSGNRLMYAKQGIAGTITHPLGHGYGAFSDDHDQPAHNMYVTYAYDLGVIGVCAFLYLLYLIYLDIKFLERKFKGTRNMYLIRGFEATFISYFLMAATIPVEYFVFTWIMIGLGMAVKNCFKEDVERLASSG